MFSFGAILAEMIAKGKVLFQSKGAWSQLDLILRVIGPPAAEDDEYVRESTYAVKYPEDPAPVLVAEMYKKILMTVEQRMPQLYKNGHTRWDKVYPNTEESRWSESLIELIEACIQFNPARRPTAAQAIAFDYFKNWHDPHKEPDCEPMDWSFDDMELKKDVLRKAMYDEAVDWHPHMRQRDKINPPSTKPWVTVKRQRSQTTRTRTQLARQSQRSSHEAPPVVTLHPAVLSVNDHNESPMGYLAKDVGEKTISSPRFPPK
jgi:serine/threonine protein kinase